jgi:protein involved in polysaccharide export with SLBB domain
MLVARTLALFVCGISCLLSLGPGSSASAIGGEGATLLFLQEEQPAASYRIKPKDVLDIRIEEACIYVTRFEVDERGLIEVTFAGEVQAAGKTVAELSADLTSELKKYMKDPKVHVRITEGRA